MVTSHQTNAKTKCSDDGKLTWEDMRDPISTDPPFDSPAQAKAAERAFPGRVLLCTLGNKLSCGSWTLATYIFKNPLVLFLLLPLKVLSTGPQWSSGECVGCPKGIHIPTGKEVSVLSAGHCGALCAPSGSLTVSSILCHPVPGQVSML